MSSSDERARAREQHILDAALLVFAQRGFAATRMDDIVLASCDPGKEKTQHEAVPKKNG